MAELKGNKYGVHRVIEPKGVLTQAAWKIDNDFSKVYSNEIVCDVTSLNIDSASFTEICKQVLGKKPAEIETQEDKDKVAQCMKDIVAKAGKHKNPWTGSVS